MEEMATGKLACGAHGVPADGAVIVIGHQLLCRGHSEPEVKNTHAVNKASFDRALRCSAGAGDAKQEIHGSLPALHTVDDPQVVLVAADSPLHLVKEVAQLHEDHQAGHGQPDVSKELQKNIRYG